MTVTALPILTAQGASLLDPEGRVIACLGDDGSDDDAARQREMATEIARRCNARDEMVVALRMAAAALMGDATTGQAAAVIEDALDALGIRP